MQSSAKMLENASTTGPEINSGHGQMERESAAKQQQQKQQEIMKNTILSQVLDKSASARLSTLMIAKPEKGRAVENMLVQMARTGQIRGKMTDEDLRKLLNRMTEGIKPNTKVNFDRRRAAIDSSDEEKQETRKDESSSDDD